jgi:anti-anti-sigma factor
MEVSKRWAGSVQVVSLLGDLDEQSAPTVREKILPLLLKRSLVLIDFTGVPYVSDSGLRSVVHMYRYARGAHTRVVLVGLVPEIRGVLAATGHLSFFHVADSISDGLAALRATERQVGGYRVVHGS